MKNISYLTLIVGALLATSCVASTYTSDANRGYANSIYYTSDDGTPAQYIAPEGGVAQLQTKTYSILGNNRGFTDYTDTIYVGNSDVVSVNLNENPNFVILDTPEDYQARITKYNSPTYTLYLNVGYPSYYDSYWYSPYWSWSYWRSPYWNRHYYGWHSAFYYDPWYRYSSWWDPWYYDYWRYDYYWPRTHHRHNWGWTRAGDRNWGRGYNTQRGSRNDASYRGNRSTSSSRSYASNNSKDPNRRTGVKTPTMTSVRKGSGSRSAITAGGTSSTRNNKAVNNRPTTSTRGA